jgi:hypothetical protein
MRRFLLAAIAAGMAIFWVTGAVASTPSTDVRLTNDCVVPTTPDPATGASSPYIAPPPCSAGTTTPGYVS